MVYLVVEEGCKAHRFFDPQHGRICVSRDAKFDEALEWNWKQGTSNFEETTDAKVVSGDSVFISPTIVTENPIVLESSSPPATSPLSNERSSEGSISRVHTCIRGVASASPITPITESSLVSPIRATMIAQEEELSSTDILTTS